MMNQKKQILVGNDDNIINIIFFLSHMKIFLEYLYTGDTNCATIDDNLSLLNMCKEFYLYENYEGEIEEYIMSNMLKSHGSQLNEVATKARSKNFEKLLNLIDACGSEI